MLNSTPMNTRTGTPPALGAPKLRPRTYTSEFPAAEIAPPSLLSTTMTSGALNDQGSGFEMESPSSTVRFRPFPRPRAARATIRVCVWTQVGQFCVLRRYVSSRPACRTAMRRGAPASARAVEPRLEPSMTAICQRSLSNPQWRARSPMLSALLYDHFGEFAFLAVEDGASVDASALMRRPCHSVNSSHRRMSAQPSVSN